MNAAPALLLCALIAQPPTEATEEDAIAEVAAVLVVAAPVPGSAVATMRSEAGMIWNRHGVRIRWRPSGSELDEHTNVVVLLSPLSRRCATASGGARPLGCFPAHHTGNALPVIVIFPEHARLLVDGAAVHLCEPCPIGWLEQQTARVLGWALAHELGHYLLGPQHSTTGLMRARYRPRDLFATDEDAFSLTDAQIAALRELRHQRK